MNLKLLFIAPHRLGFFTAMLILLLASFWWAQHLIGFSFGFSRGLFYLHYQLPPALVHSALMTLGFVPLFFAGFLFTAGPKWLNMPAPSKKEYLPFICFYFIGWIFWLIGANSYVYIAFAGLFIALIGLFLMYFKFFNLIIKSPAMDKKHSYFVLGAGIFGIICLAGLFISLILDFYNLAFAFVQMALWGFVVLTYSTVAHRMLPFFTANVVHEIKSWRPFWILWVIFAASFFQILIILFHSLDISFLVAEYINLIVSVTTGIFLIWLSIKWGLKPSFSNRLLAILHFGFLWLGIAFLLQSYSSFEIIKNAGQIQAMSDLKVIHALGMGFIGSIMIAMVTRVSCGHSGRPLKADNIIWVIFWILQILVLIRFWAEISISSHWGLMAIVALGWFISVLIWCYKLMPWYTQPRIDGGQG